MKSLVTVISPSSALTQRLGAVYARQLGAGNRDGATIIFLQGDLGSGKTTFAKGFLRAFGIVPRGASPTFVLMKHYPMRRMRAGVAHIYHCDAYRLSSAADLDALDFSRAAADPQAVILVEWPEKISSRILRPSHRVRFAYGAHQHERLLSFS